MHIKPLGQRNGGRVDSGRDYFTYNEIKTLLNKKGSELLKVKVVMEEIFQPATPPRTFYNSKASTGMVGLGNLGATCYLNALLQVSCSRVYCDIYCHMYSNVCFMLLLQCACL